MVRNKHNTPGVIKIPFWNMEAENPDAVFASVNLTFWSITLKSVANPVKSSVAKKNKKLALTSRQC